MSHLENTSCPVCGADTHRLLFRDHNRRDEWRGQGTYARCRCCSCVYLRERPPWEEILQGYSSQTSCAANPGLQAPAAMNPTPPSGLKNLLKRLLFRPHSWPQEPAQPPRHRLLDIGCGNGSKLGEFAQRGYEVWGTDVSGDALAAAKKLVPTGTFLKGELLDLGLPGGAFHYIRLDNVLEHVPQPLAVLRECRRLLPPGGQLFIYVPNGSGPSLKLLGRYSVSSWIPFHLTLFTPKSLRTLCARAGFANLSLFGYIPSSWPPLSIMQFIRREHSGCGRLCIPVGWIIVAALLETSGGRFF